MPKLKNMVGFKLGAWGLFEIKVKNGLNLLISEETLQIS
jgi:hypothetical protein